ncbi:MAG: alpha/beta hydrolase family protein [bacterium]|jgi:putative tributyrin esterase|nr:alpha/beta hydrolase family protein [bacterium]
MSRISCDFHSSALGMATGMEIILPQPDMSTLSRKRIEAGWPVLYLLHGRSDDHTIWQRRTSIERYAMAKNLAVVMPDGGRSFYTDMARGYNYRTFICEELPEIVRSFFRISTAREDTFIAGLSMGGYGAFKIALSLPQNFAAAASLSGVMDITSFMDRELDKREARNIFGEDLIITDTDNDLFHLVDRFISNENAPELMLYQCCGTEDFLYQDNLRFRDHTVLLGLNLLYEEGPGNHEWGYWDKQIEKVIDWLPVK